MGVAVAVVAVPELWAPEFWVVEAVADPELGAVDDDVVGAEVGTDVEEDETRVDGGTKL
jgi:hypothetical protein